MKKLKKNENKGILFWITGLSGCGKTSLLRSIAGLDKFQTGTIFYNGKIFSGPNFDLPTEKRKFGLVFQDSNLFPRNG